MPAEYSALAELAATVATEAGRMLLAARDRERVDVGTKTSGTDMVTEMDHRSEALIVEALTGARPDDAVLGEEGTEVGGTTGVTWVIDPLDGTTNYLYAYPGWCVSVAATIDGRSVAGAVVDPTHGDTFVAARGAGARRNGEALALADPPPLAEMLVATGFAYDPERRRSQALALADVLPRVRDVRRGGAAAVDLCWVACGHVDAFYERGLQPWDLAAGTIIASEAGARVEVAETGDPPLSFVVASHPDRFDRLMDLIDDAGADRA